MNEKFGVLSGKRKHWIYICLFFGVMSFIFLLNSPLHPWVGGDTDIDSSVFRTVSLMMRNGYMPYRDTFDHKGPLLYLINYAGDMISVDTGVWVLEYISLLITLLVLYKTALLAKCSSIQAVVSVFTAWALLFVYFEEGNLAEEYAMPFIAIALFIFMDYLMQGIISKKRLFLCGLCFGCVCLLRVNMTGVWVAFCLVVFIKSVYEKQFAELLKFVSWFLAGFSVIIIPVIIWLGMHNSLNAFWLDYVEFNLVYTSSEGGRAFFSAKWHAFFAYVNTVVCVLTIVSTVFLIIKKNRFIYGVYLLYILVNLLTISVSGMTYLHYGMILVPTVVLPVAGVFSYFNENEKSGEMLSFLAIVYLVCNVISGNWISLIGGMGSLYSNRGNKYYSGEVVSMCEVIQNNTSEEETISVYGNYNILYVVSNRMHATKYSYQYPIGEVYPKIMDEYWEQLSEEKPKIIAVQSGRYDESIQTFLDTNSYDFLWGNEQDLSSSSSIFIRSQ